MTDLIPLEQAHCLPRKGSDHKLGEARLAELLPQVPGWELAESGMAITRTFRFADYYRHPRLRQCAGLDRPPRRPPSGPGRALRPRGGALFHS